MHYITTKVQIKYIVTGMVIDKKHYRSSSLAHKMLEVFMDQVGRINSNKKHRYIPHSVQQCGLAKFAGFEGQIFPRKDVQPFCSPNRTIRTLFITLMYIKLYKTKCNHGKGYSSFIWSEAVRYFSYYALWIINVQSLREVVDSGSSH